MRMIILAIALALQACVGSIADPPLPPDAGVMKVQATDAQPTAPQCVPGTSAACACSTGRSGAQVCTAGETFGACTCAATNTAATTSTVTTPDAGIDLRPATPDLQAATPDVVADIASPFYSICGPVAGRYPCWNPATMNGWNDAGAMLPPVDASTSLMMPTPWFCLYGLRCPPCWNATTGTMTNPPAIDCTAATGWVPACMPCG